MQILLFEINKQKYENYFYYYYNSVKIEAEILKVIDKC